MLGRCSPLDANLIFEAKNCVGFPSNSNNAPKASQAVEIDSFGLGSASYFKKIDTEFIRKTSSFRRG